MQAIDYWFSYISGQGKAGEVFRAVAAELPPLSSLILDRSCRFQCQHCIFQQEASARSVPDTKAVLNILRQLGSPRVVHEGRQLTQQQLPLLHTISEAGYPIGIIESGTYTSLADNILQSDFRFDWMDISVDGPKEIHNLQRNSPRAWEVAVSGIERARWVIRPNGKLTSLMTITGLNYNHVFETGKRVAEFGVDEWHLTTLSLRSGIEGLRASASQLEIALEQMAKHGRSSMFLRIYNLDDMRTLTSILGRQAFSRLLRNAQVTQNALVLDIGFPLFFYPVSLAPSETLVIDVDGWWRLPYCIKYTLEELRGGKDKCGNDISVYNVNKISEQTDVVATQRSAVSHWQKYCGEKQLAQERELFQSFL